MIEVLDQEFFELMHYWKGEEWFWFVSEDKTNIEFTEIVI